MSNYFEYTETLLENAMKALEFRPEILSEEIRWAVEGGGKRVRPQIALAAAEAVGGKKEDAAHVAVAMELLHTYTLIHDDLPAMDNDVERRGKTTVWKKFGEADAILAGDALQAAAFSEIAKTKPKSALSYQKMMETFSTHAINVVRGQIDDIALSKKSPHAPETNEETLLFIFRHKTACLFCAAACCGALAAGATDEQVKKLNDYAMSLGMAFQYEDDLIDGDDGNFSSLNFITKEEVSARVREYTERALEALENLPGDTLFLKTLAKKLESRTV